MLSGEICWASSALLHLGEAQIRNLPYVTFDLTQSQRLVVNGDTFKH